MAYRGCPAVGGHRKAFPALQPGMQPLDLNGFGNWVVSIPHPGPCTCRWARAFSFVIIHWILALFAEGCHRACPNVLHSVKYSWLISVNAGEESQGLPPLSRMKILVISFIFRHFPRRWTAIYWLLRAPARRAGLLEQWLNNKPILLLGMVVGFVDVGHGDKFEHIANNLLYGQKHLIPAKTDCQHKASYEGIAKKDCKWNILICLLMEKQIIIRHAMKLKSKGCVLIKALEMAESTFFELILSTLLTEIIRGKKANQSQQKNPAPTVV